MKMNCPHCGGAAQIRTSRQMSPISRELRYQCIDVECGHTWVAVLEAIRTIVPSARPNPQVYLLQIELPPRQEQVPLVA